MNLGIVYVRVRRSKEEQWFLSEAAEVHPEHTHSWLTLSIAHGPVERWDEVPSMFKTLSEYPAGRDRLIPEIGGTIIGLWLFRAEWDESLTLGENRP